MTRSLGPYRVVFVVAVILAALAVWFHEPGVPRGVVSSLREHSRQKNARETPGTAAGQPAVTPLGENPEPSLPKPSTVRLEKTATVGERAPSPLQKTKTELFLERYENINVTELLKESSPFRGFGAKNSGVVAARAAYKFPRPQGEIRVFTSFSSESLENQTGCVTIRSGEIITGSLTDKSIKLIQLPDENAYGALIRNDHLIIYYANVETWGQRSPTEEPRILFYYKRNPSSKNWELQAKGNDRENVIDMDYVPYDSNDAFCESFTN